MDTVKSHASHLSFCKQNGFVPQCPFGLSCSILCPISLVVKNIGRGMFPTEAEEAGKTMVNFSAHKGFLFDV